MMWIYDPSEGIVEITTVIYGCCMSEYTISFEDWLRETVGAA